MREYIQIPHLLWSSREFQSFSLLLINRHMEYFSKFSEVFQKMIKSLGNSKILFSLHWWFLLKNQVLKEKSRHKLPGGALQFAKCQYSISNLLLPDNWLFCLFKIINKNIYYFLILKKPIWTTDLYHQYIKEDIKKYKSRREQENFQKCEGKLCFN